MKMPTLWLLVVMVLATLSGGCAVFAVADAAVTVVATTVKVGAKVVGAGVEAVLPDDDGAEVRKAERATEGGAQAR